MHYRDAIILFTLCPISSICMAEDPTGLILTPSDGNLTNISNNSISVGMNMFNIVHPYLDETATATTITLGNRIITTGKHPSVSYYSFHAGEIYSPSLNDASSTGFSFRTTSYLPHKFDWIHGYGIDYHTMRRINFHPRTIFTLNGNFGLQKRGQFSETTNIALWTKSGMAYSVIDSYGGPDYTTVNNDEGGMTGSTKYLYVSFGCSVEYKELSIGAAHHASTGYSYNSLSISFDIPT